MVIDTEAPSERLAQGHQETRWGRARNRPECGFREFHVFPPRVEKHGHDQVGDIDSQ